MRRFTILAVPTLLAACATTPKPPAIPKVEVQKVTVEVQRPCPVTVPQRPAPLALPLPADAVSLAAVLASKLVEYAGAGGYASRADAALRICTKP